MSQTGQVTLDRETLLNLRSLVQSMILCLNGFESRFSHELQMIGAINELASKALDLVETNLKKKDQVS
jgi:hypothetical protein